MPKQYIGPREVKEIKDTKEKTNGGVAIKRVTYVDGKVEHLSTLMIDATLADKVCDLTELRDKRIEPVVSGMLALLRDWGLQIGEIPAMISTLNALVQFNFDQAELMLWAKWTIDPKQLTEVTLLDADRVLLSKKITLEDLKSE